MTSPSNTSHMHQNIASEKITAWCFSASDRLPHGGNHLIVIDETVADNKIVLCKNGLYASCDPLNALYYAKGPYLHKVQCCDDKLDARSCKYFVVRDAANMLRRFAREQALSVIHLWEAPKVVKQYLVTGDETLKSIACAAASAAACAATSATISAAASAAACAAHARGARAPNVIAWATANATAGAGGAIANVIARKRFNELVDELFGEEPT
jgi:hypothetical protein